MKNIAVSTAAAASVFLGASFVSAQDSDIEKVINEVDRTVQIAQASQNTIEGIADTTSELFSQYKGVLKTNAGLRAYNAQQRRVIDRQKAELARIEASISQIDEIKRQISPLMEEMIENLAEFIESDVPFQLDERHDRVDALRDAMTDPNVNDPERFRVVLEAYNAEVQYGRTIRAYEGQLDDGRVVNFIRIGRVGYYYQTKDQSETAVWNNETKSWDTVGADFAGNIKDLERMAAGRLPTDIIILPVKTPEVK